jgi:hypothetical protein
MFTSKQLCNTEAENPQLYVPKFMISEVEAASKNLSKFDIINTQIYVYEL